MEIKFRARINEKGRAEHLAEWQHFTLDDLLDGHAYELDERIDRKTICLSTTLRDKHGKEIWEGDIVEWKGYEVQNGKQIRPTRRRVVGQTKDPFRISFIDDCFHLQNLAEQDNTLEVIGSIYGEGE